MTVVWCGVVIGSGGFQDPDKEVFDEEKLHIEVFITSAWGGGRVVHGDGSGSS